MGGMRAADVEDDCQQKWTRTGSHNFGRSNSRRKIKPSPMELVDNRERDTMGNQFYYFQERDIGYQWLIWGWQRWVA